MNAIPNSVTFMTADQLVHASNIRHAISTTHVSEMKASIQAQGIIQNLVAAPRTSDGAIAVFAGGTRLLCVQELIAEGLLPADFPIPVMVRTDIVADSPEAIEIAMSENMIRQQMDYLDECAAMSSLAAARRTEDEIAAVFGYKTRTVRERLLISRIVPEAHDIVRRELRNLDWARALTLADTAMQIKVCDDIAANPNAWKTGEDIRAYITKSTIPAENALFDRSDYTGQIVSDFFEGDKFADVPAFWALQNEAIKALQADVEAEGWAEVLVQHEPFQEWRYTDCATTAEATAIIEILPTGKVNVIRGKTALASETISDEARLKDQTVEQHHDSIGDLEVRPTTRALEYAAAHRSAMLQATIGSNFRASLEYTVLAFLGVRTAAFNTSPFQVPGPEMIKTGRAFEIRLAVADDIREATRDAEAIADRELRDATYVSVVRSMDDSQLQVLFSLLVGQRVGQPRKNAADDGESLANIFGATIDVRSFWTPTTEFFELMGTDDLRRLAGNLLPGASKTGFAATKRKDLVRALADAFTNAADGTTSGAMGSLLNSWVPGILSFPAIIATNEVSAEASIFQDNLEDMIFAGADQAAA